MGSTTLVQADSYVITMAVSGNLMDVTVNGLPVVNDAKLNRTSGWLGVIAYGGEVKFENLQVTVTGISGEPE